MSKKIEYTKSTGNVFADMGFKDANERLVKADLAIKITKIIKDQYLRQEDAAEFLGLNQPKISAIANGRLKDFSIGRLIDILMKLNQDIEINVHPIPKTENRKAIFKVVDHIS